MVANSFELEQAIATETQWWRSAKENDLQGEKSKSLPGEEDKGSNNPEESHWLSLSEFFMAMAKAKVVVLLDVVTLLEMAPPLLPLRL